MLKIMTLRFKIRLFFSEKGTTGKNEHPEGQNSRTVPAPLCFSRSARSLFGSLHASTGMFEAIKLWSMKKLVLRLCKVNRIKTSKLSVFSSFTLHNSFLCIRRATFTVTSECGTPRAGDSHPGSISTHLYPRR
jgi:hypothetical protein